MKLVTLDGLKSFFSYMKDSFVSPYAKRDDAGNDIKKTYLRKDDKIQTAESSKKADRAVADEDGNAFKDTYFRKTDGNLKLDKIEANTYLAVTSKSEGISGISFAPQEVAKPATLSYSGTEIESTHPIKADLAGNADTATKLKTPRSITLTGDVTGTASFDGSDNASIMAKVSPNVASKSDTYLLPFFRQAKTEYKVGDVAYSALLGPRYRLYCVKAGTTADGEISLEEG